MSDHLLAIGMFVFGTDRTSYQELERKSDWKWEGAQRFGARDALQFTGPGQDTLTINGVLIPEVAGSYADIEKLREMADSGEVQDVVLGTGKVVGQYVIVAVDERGSNHVKGGMARKYDFAVDLLAYQP